MRCGEFLWFDLRWRRDAKAPNLDMAFLMLLEIMSHGLGVHLEHTIAILQIQMVPLLVTAGLHVDGELQLGVLCLRTGQCMVHVVIIRDLIVAVDLDAEIYVKVLFAPYD